MLTYDEIAAEHEAERRRELAAARKRITLFALESVAGDGLPRVSPYTVDTLVREGLIERVPGDNLQRLRLTPEGRVTLQANPAGQPATDELALFGGA